MKITFLLKMSLNLYQFGRVDDAQLEFGDIGPFHYQAWSSSWDFQRKYVTPLHDLQNGLNIVNILKNILNRFEEFGLVSEAKAFHTQLPIAKKQDLAQWSFLSQGVQPKNDTPCQRNQKRKYQISLLEDEYSFPWSKTYQSAKKEKELIK